LDHFVGVAKNSGLLVLAEGPATAGAGELLSDVTDGGKIDFPSSKKARNRPTNQLPRA